MTFLNWVYFFRQTAFPRRLSPCRLSHTTRQLATGACDRFHHCGRTEYPARRSRCATAGSHSRSCDPSNAPRASSHLSCQWAGDCGPTQIWGKASARPSWTTRRPARTALRSRDCCHSLDTKWWLLGAPLEWSSLHTHGSRLPQASSKRSDRGCPWRPCWGHLEWPWAAQLLLRSAPWGQGQWIPRYQPSRPTFLHLPGKAQPRHHSKARL